ncbi:MAG: uracil-DNA glycosylase [Spirochaetia bacterium]|jgi:DNA polymerase|nr:uracil-DNA glycosylase [Spirochaetia bacterium]
MNYNGINYDSKDTGSMDDKGMDTLVLDDKMPASGNEREILYQALSTIEDALGDGYHSRRPLPEFAPDRSGEADSRRMESGQTERLQADHQKTARIPEGQSGGHEDLASIASALARCRACRLAITRKQVVPGTGPANAALFVLGEYPSDAGIPGLPFSQEAGQLMDKMLAAIGLDRSRDCFETTAVKCRPPMNRDPAPDELSSCLPFLERQILSVRPKAILAFGRISAQILLGSRDALPSFRGTVHLWRGIPLVATYHPEAILKDESLKRPAWEDLKLLKTIINDA